MKNLIFIFFLFLSLTSFIPPDVSSREIRNPLGVELSSEEIGNLRNGKEIAKKQTFILDQIFPVCTFKEQTIFYKISNETIVIANEGSFSKPKPEPIYLIVWIIVPMFTIVRLSLLTPDMKTLSLIKMYLLNLVLIALVIAMSYFIDQDTFFVSIVLLNIIVGFLLYRRYKESPFMVKVRFGGVMFLTTFPTGLFASKLYEAKLSPDILFQYLGLITTVSLMGIFLKILIIQKKEKRLGPGTF